MEITPTCAEFVARIHQPTPDLGGNWGFILVPHDASAILPRRGRITVEGKINGATFHPMLEPDGNKSHWLKLDNDFMANVGVNLGDDVLVSIAVLDNEPLPSVPEDFDRALQANSDALAVWQKTTAVAQVDWIHWVTSAKQAKTREKRISGACDMLASGKKRVCCFDTSGFYSKAFKAPVIFA